jgi:hypothetical protein
MLTKLIKTADGLALAIDPALLAQLGIDEDTPPTVRVEGRSRVICQEQNEQRQRNLQRALQSANELYGQTLKRLAEES